jgi:hypothetical protein
LSDDERKSASATIAGEALKVVPEADKQMAGRSFGGALTNLGAALEDVTLWVRLVASVPRGATTFVAKVIDRWRSIPSDRRALPSAKLLLEAAASYGAITDDDLKVRYERLLFSAVDSEAAPRVHPAFVEMIGQMTGAEVRLADHFPIGGYFESYQALTVALGFSIDHHHVEIGMRNLLRLGLITEVGPDLLEPSAAPDHAFLQRVAKLSGGIHVQEVIRVQTIDIGGRRTGTTRTTATVNYRLTALGADFLAVVGTR